MQVDESLERFELPSELQELRATIRLTNRLLPNRLTCYYCGHPATCEDHAIPHSLLARVDVTRNGYGVDTLPSCTECNTLLGSKVFDTLAERKGYLSKQLRKRHKRDLVAPQWSDSELAELAYNLRERALATRFFHSDIVRRLETLERGNPIHLSSLPELPIRRKRRYPIPPHKGKPVWTQDSKGEWDFTYPPLEQIETVIPVV